MSSNPLDDLVSTFDELRTRTGSYLCPPDVERRVSSLAAKAMASEQRRPVVEGVLRQLESSPGQDWIFRSSLTHVEHEPRSMESVFMPRDPRRPGIFLPYVLFALGKLFANFHRPQVQADLKAGGHDPRRVGLAPLIQVVAGARDRSQALGRERTVSFSADFGTRSRDLTCRLVFGLPLLATRPERLGSSQATVASIRGTTLGSWRGLDRENVSLAWSSGGSQRVRQTHQAVLIPDKGIEYEAVDSGRFQSIPLRNAQRPARCPLPSTGLNMLLEQLSTIVSGLAEKDFGQDKSRLDGVLTQTVSGNWDDLQIVGIS